MLGLSLAGSVRSLMGSRTVTLSPAFQARATDAYVPGAVLTPGIFSPLTLISAPDVHDGMRMRIVHSPAAPWLSPLTVRLVVSSTGKAVACVMVMPRSDHVSTEGVNKFTNRVELSWK